MIWCCDDNQRSDGGRRPRVSPAQWQAGLDELLGRVAGRFGRIEPRQHARAFVLGLLADLAVPTTSRLATVNITVAGWSTDEARTQIKEPS
jgi:hypothetical protein